MPQAPLEEPGEKVTLLLYAKDVTYLKSLGPGWTTKVREIIRKHVKEAKRERTTS